uniref:C6 domain-containing protein n=1 Tax=Gongylonema pulchrum TaxID=637853 RepID=A0A183CYX6_9BILA
LFPSHHGCICKYFSVCCPALTTGNPPRVAPPAGSPGAGLDECSILRRFSRGVCPQFAQVVSQVVVQIVNGANLVASNTGPTVAMLTIECVAPGTWMYRNNRRELSAFTGVSCNQGTLTSGDYVVNYQTT